MTSTNCFRMKSRRPIDSSLCAESECDAAVRQAPTIDERCRVRQSRLDVVGEHPAQTLVVAAAAGEASATAEDDHVVAVKPWLQLANRVDMHDRRAMHAQKRARVQLRLQRAKAFAHQMARRADMQAHIIVSRLDPVDVVAANEERAATA